MSFLAIVAHYDPAVAHWKHFSHFSCANMKKAVYEAYSKKENGESNCLVAYCKRELIYKMESNQETIFPQKGLIGTAHS